MKRASLFTRLLVLCALPVLAAVPSCVIIARSFEVSALAEAAVQHAILALERSNELSASVDEAILEERGFVATGDEQFAERYYAASTRFDWQWRILHDAIDPAQRAELQQLSDAFHKWRSSVADPVLAARRRGDPDSSAALVASSGRALSRHTRELAEKLTRAQSQHVSQRLEESQRIRASAIRLSIITMAVGMLTVFAVAVSLSLWLRRRVRELSLAADSLAEGDLSRRAVVPGSDEIARLARSFNAMADALLLRTRNDASLRRLTELLQACSSLDEAYRLTNQMIGGLFPGVHGTVHMLNASRTLLEITAEFGAQPGEEAPPPSAPEDCWAFRRGNPYEFEAGESAPRCQHAGIGEGSSYVCLPLMAHGENLGVLTLSPQPDAAQAGITVLVAEQLGLALANLRLRDTLRSQAIRDGLTGLYNRRYYEEVAERELARARRHRRPVSFLVLDVDHFKRFNDTFGHDAGDLLLREVGRLLRQSVRKGDVACRYGGEEFVLILPESSADDAQKRADQIRALFHGLSLAHRDQLLGAVTVSIGIAAFPEHGEDRDTLLRAGDAALYRAKALGRDRSVIAEVEGGSRVGGSESRPLRQPREESAVDGIAPTAPKRQGNG